MPHFEIGERDFLLDDRPFQVISGALHYFRVHPDLWADRIRKARLMGLNTIETYVPWNFHAPSANEFDLTGQRDLGRFLDLVAAEGLHAIVRPGPYICSEWDGGGLPAWLFADPTVGVRRHEEKYLAAIERYYSHILPVVAPRQVSAGGSVLMVQVENEYGAYPGVLAEERARYLRALVDMIRAQGIDVPLFTSDQPDHLGIGGLPELHKTANFGSRSADRLAVLREHQPTGPLMCMEFWNGWFDSWGVEHHVTAPEANAKDLDELLGMGASVNIYMFHGGTNFGLTNGANHKGTYLPLVTSYDYDAPLSEHGAATAKFYALREVIARHAPVPELDESVTAPVAAAPELIVALPERASLLGVQDLLEGYRSLAAERLPTMDDIAQWSGFALYTTQIHADDAVLVLDDVRDRAWAFLDGQPIGYLDRSTHVTTLPLPARAGQLALLVEDRGRVNYGERIGEPKGLIGPARTATRNLTAWAVVGLSLDDIASMPTDRWDQTDPAAPFAGPAFRRGTFSTTAGVDHFLALDGWTGGLAWVNGFLLGRYSANRPTRTMYVPGPLLRAQGNELVVLELTGAHAATAAFVPGPDLGTTEA